MIVRTNWRRAWRVYNYIRENNFRSFFAHENIFTTKKKRITVCNGVETSYGSLKC